MKPGLAGTIFCPKNYVNVFYSGTSIWKIWRRFRCHGVTESIGGAVISNGCMYSWLQAPKALELWLTSVRSMKTSCRKPTSTRLKAGQSSSWKSEHSSHRLLRARDGPKKLYLSHRLANSITLDLLTNVQIRSFREQSRVEKILGNTHHRQWRHLAGVKNPADLCSRGIDPQNVKELFQFHQGPQFLQFNPSEWNNWVETAEPEESDVNVIRILALKTEDENHPVDQCVKNCSSLLRI